MAYILFSVSVFFIFLVTVAFLTRAQWSQHMPDIHLPGARLLYSHLPNSFTGDIDAGLSSSTFDLSTNVEAGDSRQGLDNAAKAEVLKIMKRRRMTFDQARKAYMESKFQANGIGADGRPTDPKFVSFS